MYIAKEDGFARQYSDKANDLEKNFNRESADKGFGFVSKLFGLLLFFLVLSSAFLLIYEAGAHVTTPDDMMRLREEIRYL